MEAPTASSRTALSPSDRIMWRIERDAVLRSPILVVGLLDREPTAAATRATVERAIAAIPRLRQVVRPAAAGQVLVWEDDERFTLDYHLRRVSLGGAGDVRAVLDLAGPWVSAALDPARPLWELTVVDGLHDGRSAFVLKLHHTITDGVGGVDLAAKIFDADRHGRPSPPTPAEDQVGSALEDGGAPGHPPGRSVIDLTRQAARFARSLGRVLAPAPRPLSPLLVGRSLDRHLDVLEVPLESLQRVAHDTGVTVNDLFLAAIGGALHELHLQQGHRVPALRITMPISVRREGDPEGGNRFAPARFVLPIDDPDLVQRARIASGIAHAWRHEPALATTNVLAAALDRLPSALLAPLFGAMLKNIDVDAVDVPGLRGDAFLGGARIDRMWAFAPPTGAAMSITLLSHGDHACIGIVADGAAVAEPALVSSHLAAALDEIKAIGARS